VQEESAQRGLFPPGQPDEEPAVGNGHVAGQEQERVPLCVTCLELLLADPAAFWKGMRKGRGK
jgi:hypothetical protein